MVLFRHEAVVRVSLNFLKYGTFAFVELFSSFTLFENWILKSRHRTSSLILTDLPDDWEKFGTTLKIENTQESKSKPSKLIYGLRSIKKLNFSTFWGQFALALFPSGPFHQHYYKTALCNQLCWGKYQLKDLIMPDPFPFCSIGQPALWLFGEPIKLRSGKSERNWDSLNPLLN